MLLKTHNGILETYKQYSSNELYSAMNGIYIQLNNLESLINKIKNYGK